MVKKAKGSYTADFIEFGRRPGIQENRIEKLLDPFPERNPFMETLVSRSFLPEPGKREYLLM